MPSGWSGHKERNSAIGTIDVRWWISCCRERISDELNRHQPLLGDCLSSFASCFSITFFEPEFNGDVKHTSNVSQFSPEANGKSFRHEKEHRIASLRRCDDEHRAHYLTFDQSDRGDRRTCRHSRQIRRCSLRGGSDSAIIFTLLVVGGRITESQTIDGVSACLHLTTTGRFFLFTNLTRPKVTNVTAERVNSILGSVLKLINNNIDAPEAPWMNERDKHLSLHESIFEAMEECTQWPISNRFNLQPDN